jgi:hypothetical protein
MCESADGSRKGKGKVGWETFLFMLDSEVVGSFYAQHGLTE